MTSRRSFLRRLALTAGAGAMACWTAAPAARPLRVAVLSLIGDRLLIVGSQMSTGSHLDRNRRETLALPNDDLDVAAAREFERTGQAARPGIAITPVRSRDSAVRELHDGFVAGGKGLAEIVERVGPTLAAQGFTHLVVLTRHRGEARIRTREGLIGIGRLEGLGFYVDRWTRMGATEGGPDSGLGFLAPFAYFRASLVDLATRSVLGEEASQESQAFPTVDSRQGAHPWDALGADEKTLAIARSIAVAMERVAPRLLARLPAPG